VTRLVRRVLALAALAAAWPAPSAAQVRNWPAEVAPKPLAARPVSFPPYEVRTLPNGLRVVVVAHHEQPAVSLRMLVSAGTAQDAATRLGVANMVASMLDQGTSTRTARQIAESVDAIGGDLVIGAGTDVTVASLTALRDRVADGLALLADIVQAPAFRPDEIERQRAQWRSALRVSYQDPDYVASVVVKRIVYGLHPYGLPAQGTPASVERLTRADLVDFHQRYFAPGNCILAVVGDIGAAEAFAAVEKAFGAWPAREVIRTLMLGPPPPARRVVVVDMPGAVQTEIRVGQLGLMRTSADFTATDLAVRVLGGDGANRLQQILRTRRGLTYGASADLNSHRMLGDIVAETDTRPEAAGEALRVIVDEFARLQRERVDPRELEEARAFLAGSYPLSIESPDQIGAKVVTALFYGLPLPDLATFRERVNAVTADDIQRVTRAHLKPDRLSIVLVGYGPFILNELARLGFRGAEWIRIETLDLTSADLRGPPLDARPAVPPVTTVQGMSKADWEQVRVVVDEAITAAGGIDVLRGVKTLRATARTVMQTPAGPLRATTRTYLEYPGRMRVDATLPAGDVVQGYNDGHAWLKDATGVRDAPEPMREEFAQGLRRDWIALLLAAADNRVLGRLLPDERGLGGRPLRVVELWAEGLPPVRVALDAATHLISSVSYETGKAGARATVRESYADYRDVKGVKIPFTAVVRRDDAVMLERTITDVQINVTFAPGFFEKGQ
jgi:zinc protease